MGPGPTARAVPRRAVRDGSFDPPSRDPYNVPSSIRAFTGYEPFPGETRVSKATNGAAIEPQTQGLRTALVRCGHRYTAQRAAVYETLYAASSHPTADEIFTSVRREIPDISLATVYKALEAFVGCGIASKLTMGNGPARYDGRMDAHEHIRCLSCGTVSDVDHASSPDWLNAVSLQTDFQVLGYRLELVGTCPACQA
ncbi:MAG: transcriptional repressor [Gemmatimonadota bacterium]|nr:MAG: transcriptional repressor [Gemmatimonadota bacterium]